MMLGTAPRIQPRVATPLVHEPKVRCAVNLDYAPKLKGRHCFGGFRGAAGNINTFNLLQRPSVEKRLDDQGNNSYDWIKFPGSDSGCHEAVTCSLMLKSGPRSTASPLSPDFRRRASPRSRGSIQPRSTSRSA